jgi:hypothetical protein
MLGADHDPGLARVPFGDGEQELVFARASRWPRCESAGAGGGRRQRSSPCGHQQNPSRRWPRLVDRLTPRPRKPQQ